MGKCYDIHRIKVHVRGGCVQDIEDIPEGVEVHVYDYDTEGSEEEDGLTQTPDGLACIGIWEN